MPYGEKEKERTRRYREKHREELNKRDRDRYWNNPEKFREKTRLWRKKNYKKWWKKNGKKEKIRLKKLFRKNKKYYMEMSKIRQWKYKFIAMQKISGKRIPECINCKEKDIRILTINHINGITKKERKIKKDWNYRNIVFGRRKINDLDIRCFNCNILYEYDRGNYSLNKNVVEKILKEKGIIRMSDKLK